MANPSFYMLVEYLVSLLGGGSFQDSSFGDQVRPLNNSGTVTDLQVLLRKGRFANLRNLWHSLTTAEKNTFIAAAGTLPGALYLFLSSNIIRILIGQTLLSSYTSSVVPPDMPLQIDDLSISDFTVSASGALTVVPVGYSLLIYGSVQKLPAQIISNPKEYNPILYFPAGTDLSAAVSIFLDYSAYYGRIKDITQICIKSLLADVSNGAIGAASFVCASISGMSGNFIVDSDGTYLVNSDGTFISYP
jgi:hypothetical protein